MKSRKIRIDLLQWIKFIQEDNERKYNETLKLLNKAKDKLRKNADGELIKEINNHIRDHTELLKLEIEIEG